MLILFTVADRAKAQELFFGFGFSFFTDHTSLVVHEKNNVQLSGSHSLRGYNLVSLSSEMKHNLHELNTEKAVSVSFSPSIGIGALLNPNISGNIRLPFYVQLDIGKLATLKSRSGVGLGIGLGYQYDIYNIYAQQYDLVTLGTVAGKLAFRFNDTSELSFKMGMPKTGEYPVSTINSKGFEEITYQNTQVTSYQITFLVYFIY